MDGRVIDIRNTAFVRHGYDGDHPEMRRLYEQAKRDQWNAATDIDWAAPLEGDGGLIADEARHMGFGLLTPRVAPQLASLGISLG